MGISVKINDCHGHCHACYQDRIREKSNVVPDYPAMVETLKKLITADEKKERRPTIHGGEPLMMPLNIFEEMLYIIHEAYGNTAIQTGMIGMEEKHIDLFCQYKTAVGFSLDGDYNQTNAGRMFAIEAGSRQKTINKILTDLDVLKNRGLSLSMITLARQCNYCDIPRFIESMQKRYELSGIRVNPALVHGSDPTWEISGTIWGELLLRLFRRWDGEADWRPLRDIQALLNGGSGTCTFGECDIWRTDAETTILPDGSLGGCQHGGSAFYGIAALRADKKGDERSQALRQTDQSGGGCKGCFWWQYCHGGCPAAGIGDDWRNRSRWCEGWKIAFEHAAKQAWYNNDVKNKSANGHGDSHGDSNDPAWRAANPWWPKGKKPCA